MARPKAAPVERSTGSGPLRPGTGAWSLTDRRAGVVAAAAAVVLVVVAFQLLARGPLLREDAEVRASLLHHRTAWLGDVMTAVTTAAAVPVSVAAVLTLAAAVTWRRRVWSPLVLGVCAVALLGATVGAGKLLTGRGRPPQSPNDLFSDGTSFPSGHTTGIVVLAGCVLLLVGPQLPSAGRWLLRTATVSVAVTVGASRLYLDQHWLTDIVASWALGVLIVCALAVLAARLPAWAVTVGPRPGPGNAAPMQMPQGR